MGKEKNREHFVQSFHSSVTHTLPLRFTGIYFSKVLWPVIYKSDEMIASSDLLALESLTIRFLSSYRNGPKLLKFCNFGKI